MISEAREAVYGAAELGKVTKDVFSWIERCYNFRPEPVIDNFSAVAIQPQGEPYELLSKRDCWEVLLQLFRDRENYFLKSSRNSSTDFAIQNEYFVL